MGRKQFFTGVAVGAGLMYLFDPHHGMARRERVRRRLDRVRADLGEGGVFDGGHLTRWLDDGAVRLRRDDIAGLDSHVLRSGLPGPSRVKASSAVVSAAGGALAVYGLTRRGRIAAAMRTLGTTILAAGLKDLDATPAGFLRERRKAVEAQRSVDIAVSPALAYQFWRNCENVPLFLSHVTEVADLGAGLSRWKVDGRAGGPVHWTAAVTEDIPDRLLAWHSEPGSPVQQSATVRFAPAGRGTRVDVRVRYQPPAGAVGRAVADLLGADPDRRLAQDLSRVKALLETVEGD